MITEIQKPKGLNDLLKDYKPAKIDEVKAPETASSTLIETLRKYKGFLDRIEKKGSDCSYDDIEHALEIAVKDVLKPKEIDQFLKTTTQYEQHSAYQKLTGTYITRLIQNSYNKGNNNFTIDKTDTGALEYFLSHAEGYEERPLNVKIKGDIGTFSGLGMQNCNIEVDGNVNKEFAIMSYGCDITIRGDAGNNLGEDAENTTFTVYGSIGKDCGGNQARSTIGAAQECIFKTPNQETLDTMLEDVEEGNTIIFIQPDGTEEIKRDQYESR